MAYPGGYLVKYTYYPGSGLLKTGPGGGGQVKSYSDMRALTFSLPALAEGSLFEIAARFEKRPVLAGQFVQRFDLHFPLVRYAEPHLVRIDPVFRSEISVTAAAGPGLRWQGHGAPPVQEEDEGAARRYRWTLDNLPGLPLEKFMPSLDDLLPSIVVTTLPDWNVVDSWAHGLFAGGVEVTGAIREQAQAVTAGLDGREARVAADLGRGGYQPHRAGEVLANRYGDCKDQVVLLLSLFQAVGIEAFPALVNPVGSADARPDLPSYGFGHAIVYLPGPERELWLDPTPVGEAVRLHWTVQERQALIVDGRGGRLQRTPAAGAGEHQGRLVVTSRFQEGRVEVELTLSGEGGISDFLKESCQRLPEERRPDLVLALVRTLHPLAQEVAAEVADCASAAPPFRATARYRLPAVSSQLLDAPVQVGGSALPALGLFAGLDSLPLPTARRSPFANFLPLRIVNEWRYEVPQGLRLVGSLPAATAGGEALLRYRATSSQGQDHALVRYEIELERGEVAVAAYEPFYQATQRMLQEMSFRFAVAPRSVDPRGQELAERLGTSPGSIDEILALARHQLGRAQYGQAKELLEEAVIRAPSHGEAHYLLGLANGYLGDRDRASSLLKKARELGYRP
ncbi:MAG: DUF3857 domain-containing protein [Thermodesulfobacteriota bacterium]